MRKELKLGVFGFGCVGQGLYDVLNQTKGIKAEIVKICVKDRTKKRKIDSSFFTYDKNELLNNPEIDIIVELIDNADEAFDIVSSALKKGKGVVTANKKMLAEHFDELYSLQQEYKVPLLYEAAACASIPVIRNLEEYYDNDLLNSIEGIVNGTTNYILSKLSEGNVSYQTALKEAQELGFAESNPSFDVGGFDAKYKTCLLTAHAFGIFIEPEQIFNYGIESLSEFDIQYAKEKNYKIKLLAKSIKIQDKLAVWVLPQFIKPDHVLYQVNDVYNGVQVEAVFSDKQFFQGKGAGSHPTGSAVLSDISALTYNYRYEYKKYSQEEKVVFSNDFILHIFCRYKSDDLPDIDFETIEEHYKGKEFSYIVGKVNWNLLTQSKSFQDKNIFIAQTANAELSLAEEVFEATEFAVV